MNSYGNSMFSAEDGGFIIHEPRTERECVELLHEIPKRFSCGDLILFLLLYLLYPPENAAVKQRRKAVSANAPTKIHKYAPPKIRGRIYFA